MSKVKIFIIIMYIEFLVFLNANSVDPDQKPRSAASDHGFSVCQCPCYTHFKFIRYSHAIYEGPAKSFVTRFGLLQCYVLSNIFFITNLQSIHPLLKHIFVTFLPSREKQINSLLLVSVGDTDK